MGPVFNFPDGVFVELYIPMKRHIKDTYFLFDFRQPVRLVQP